jgi:hypothetical protein
MVRRNLTDYGVRLEIPRREEEEEDAMRKADEADAKHEELRAKEAVLDGLLRDVDVIREDLRKEASMKQMRVELRERVLAKKTQMQQGRGLGAGLTVM